ncbi:OmpA family protein [Phaeobacter italicus]|uniref:OmpA family protein n=1 Tax=Phaeobacter italicus TaxID=481446 RepID=UPI000186F692|nr:OmpA family protein [Phaeobacter italicus]EEB72043.1 outer membrane protein, OmpA/MotB family [Ruegeria sp. R11]CRL13061.1 putative outer membrane lipoprotein [Phaeobacter italicus]SFH35237.1 Outer membrane protein OmpA [Phaeobacter italicus]
MKPGIFKSSTALAVMISLAAPLPALSQNKGGKQIDLSQMSVGEISDLVDRCRKRAERTQKKLAAGQEVEEKTGKIAKFCKAYGTGAFDADLPGELQSASVLASVAELTADADVEADAEVQASEPTDAPPTEAADTQPQADAAETAGTDTSAEADTESAPAPQTDAPAGTPAADDVTEAADGSEATAEAIAADLAQSPEEADEGTDNPELAEIDSQAQADALADALDGDGNAASAAAASASDPSTGEAEPEVIEEVVTEETARSSDEEFETAVGDAAPAPQQNAAAPEDDSGLSTRERNVLLGLGALAIGTLLNNGSKVVANSGDRAIVEQNGQYRVLKDDDALLRQPGSNVTTYRFADGSTRTVVVRENGVEVETIRSAEGRVLRRTKLLPDGRSVVLFDDTQKAERVVVNELPQVQEDRSAVSSSRAVSAEDLAAALAAQDAKSVERRFSLAQIRNIDAVRRLTPVINVDSVNFDTGSSVIRPQEAEELAALGNALRELIDRNPAEVFLIEGHTDAVGAATFNLALSDRRAETVALALTEYFDVPPENMVVQGYGESDLAVRTLTAERANRRVAVRRITQLLSGAQ